MSASNPPVDHGDHDDHDDHDDGERWLSNAGSLVGGRLLVAVLGWSGTIIIARTLDQETFGRFTFVFGVLGMMTIATDLGLGRVAISGVLPDADDRPAFAGTYIVLRSVLGLVGYGLAVGFTAIAGYPSEIISATAIAGLMVIIATASHAYELILQANLRMHVVAVSAVLGRLSQLGLIVAVVVAGGGFLWLLVPAVLAELVIAAIKVPRALRLQPMSYSVRPRLWWTLLVEAVPLSIGTALTTLYFRVDSIMLSKLGDFADVAVYGVAFKFIDLLHFLAISISAPLLTVLVKSWHNDKRAFHGAVDRATALLTLLAGVLVVHFALFAEQTIELLYGPSYSVGALALRLLIVGEVIAFCSILGLTMLTATGHHRPFPLIALAGLLVNVGLNAWVIPRWSFEGAAVTTILTELVVVLAMWWLVRRVPGLTPRSMPGFMSSSITVSDWLSGWMSSRGGVLVRGVAAIGLAVGLGAALRAVTPWPVAAVGAAVVYGATALSTGLFRRAGVMALLGSER